MSTPRITDEAVAEIAARMFDGDLIRQPQRVQDAIWRDARFALDAALSHLAPQPVDRESLTDALANHQSDLTDVSPRDMCTCGAEVMDWDEHRADAVLALLAGGAS